VFSILVYNRCSDFELVFPTYFGHNAIWFESPDYKVDANATTRASFGRDVTKHGFTNALIYKLQRKKRFESSADNTFSKDTSINLQLLVIWRATDKSDVSLRALLIKHSNVITWDEDKLEKLHSMHLALLRKDEIVRDTWLLDDVTVLGIILRWEKGRYMTKITISEETKEDDSMDPLGIPSSI
jgi:hypothetical protein